jgi:hypothetical protein
MDGNFRMSEAHDKKILEAVYEDGGSTALQISDRCGLPASGNGRMRSGAMRSWLSLLERRGLVRKMDDMKPICWIRTTAGSATFTNGDGK